MPCNNGGMMNAMNSNNMSCTGNPNNVQMVNFQTNMQEQQGMGMGPGGGPGACGPQTVNNTYVNATMTIQQMNIQNMQGPPPPQHSVVSCSYSSGNPNMNMGMNMGMGMGMGMGHPNNGNGMMQNSPGMGPNQGMQQKPPSPGMNPMLGPPGVRGPSPGFPGPPMGPRGRLPGPGQGPGPGPMQNAPGGPPMNQMGPYSGGASVHIKASAPNTIQYMPARPQPGGGPNCGPGGMMPSNPNPRPSLDFLNRFTNPLNNLDNKLPTQNLQYFPNAQGPPNGAGMGPSNQMGGQMPMGGPMNMGGGMPQQMGPHHMGPAPNGPPMMGPCPPPHMGGMNGPMPPGPGMGMGGHMSPMGGPNQPMMGPRPSPMMGGQFHQQSNMPGDFNGPNQMMFNPRMMGPGQGPGPGPGPPGPQMGGPVQPVVSPDATQPLPPSGGSFKGSFMGPTTQDPNYAQQFHNFQQQLYATNTNRSGPPPQMQQGPPQSQSGPSLSGGNNFFRK